MSKQLEAALMVAVVAVAFVALEIILDIKTGLAGLFVMGMAGGLVIGDAMAKKSPK